MIRALAVGIPAGFLFNYLHSPIPWMIGPMVAVATLNLMGVRMHSPPYARQMGQVILGSAVSLYFTPPVVAALAGNFPAIAAATVAVFLVGIFGALTLSRASGVDAKSTFFASIPGGAMAMAVLADRYGAQIAPVAVAHSLRVSVVVILVPFALTYGGFPLEVSAYRPTVPLDLSILAIWLAISWLLGEISEKFHFHNGCLLVPIFFGAAMMMSGLFILIASVLAGAALAWAFSLPIATMILATSPGGLAEMTITAQALQISVPLVVAFHLFRVVVVNMGTQYIYVWTAWMLGREAQPESAPTSAPGI